MSYKIVEKLFSHVDLNIKTLWLVDENITQVKALPRNFDVVGNRIDLIDEFKEIGVNAFCNDFEVPLDYKYEQALLRLPKSKPLSLHCLDQIAESLTEGAVLVLVGYNGEGIQNMIKLATKRIGFLNAQFLEGNGLRIARIKKAQALIEQPSLGEKEYSKIYELNDPYFTDDFKCVSKPGIYGFNKVDLGSVFLTTTIYHYYQQMHTGLMAKEPLEKGLKSKISLNKQTKHPSLEDRAILDLGCGYGYLSLRLYPFFVDTIYKDATVHWVATDNNITATQLMEENARMHAYPIEVVLADCARELNSKSFHLIICNPPFHQGFSTNSELTNKFIHACVRLLKKGGQAWFVFNRFVKCEQMLMKSFSNVEEMALNNQFKVICVTA